MCVGNAHQLGAERTIRRSAERCERRDGDREDACRFLSRCVTGEVARVQGGTLAVARRAVSR